MSNFQISGLSSGIDWGEIIDKLISNKKAVEEQWLETQDTLDSKSYLYTELVASLKSLQSSLDPLVLESTFLNKSAEVSGYSGSEAPVSVTATADAGIARYDIDITSVAKNHKVAGDRVDDTTAALGLEGSFTLSVGDFDVTVDVASGYDLSAIAEAINAAAHEASEGGAPPVSALLLDNTLVISSEITGADFGVSVSDDGDGILSGLGIWNVGGSGEYARTLQVPTDAMFTMDGLEITRSSNTVDDLLEGVTFEIESEGSARVDISLDAEKAVSAVRGMTEAYNEVLDWIDIRLTENTVDDPQSDIEKRRGLLKGDPLLWNCKQNMRSITSKARFGSGGESRTLSSIGIAAESTDYGKSGKLEFDESAFMESMLRDPKAVMEMMTSFAADMKSFTEGMVSNSTVSIGGTTAKEGKIYSQIDTLEKQSEDIDERIADFDARLEMEQASLEALYANMEARISELSQQASYLTSLSQYSSSGSTEE